MRIAIFLALGLLLAGINVWYVLALKSAFFERANSIGPLQIIGRENKDGILGLAMAHELQARLSLLQSELAEGNQPTSGERSNATFLPLGIPLRQTDVPDRIFAPLDIKLNLAGVEVSGILPRLHRLLTAPQVLDFVVEFQEHEAIVVGNLDLLGGRPLYVRTKPSADEIITAIAYAIYQRKLAKEIDHVAALELDEFRELINHLLQVARLNRKLSQQTATVEDYRALLPSLQEIARKTPHWRDIVHLTAEVAENADDSEAAITLYRRELTLLKENDPLRTNVSDRIARLEQTLRVAMMEPPVPVHDSNTVLKRMRESPWGKSALAVLGIEPHPAVELASSPTIAILGNPPSPGLLPDHQVTYLRSTARGPDFETRYMDDLVRLILLVAPSARFTFTSLRSSSHGGYLEPEIIDALTALLVSSPDILLVTYGPLWGTRLEQIFRQAAEGGALVVVAAEVADPRFAQLPFKVMPKTITVAGLTSDNQPVTPLPPVFQRQEVFGMLGWELPTLSVEGRIEPKTGNSYAAALAAGALWRLKQAAPSFTAGEITHVLRSSSRTVGDGLLAIDIRAAIREVRDRVQGQTIRLQQDVNRAIPDNDPKGISSVQHVAEHGVIKIIRVTVDITHTYTGDLVVGLVSPTGTRLVLHDRVGGSHDDIRKTYSLELAALIGAQIHGDWTLEVRDVSAMDTGVFNYWILEIGYVE
jgi:hypothetical protein